MLAGLTSLWREILPSVTDSTPVDPLPQKRSRTVSPATDKISMRSLGICGMKFPGNQCIECTLAAGVFEREKFQSTRSNAARAFAEKARFKRSEIIRVVQSRLRHAVRPNRHN